MTKVIRIRQNGLLTLPAELQKKYQINEGDSITLVDLDGGWFLSPQKSILPNLVSEIEKLREKNGISVDELIQGVREQRNKSNSK